MNKKVKIVDSKDLSEFKNIDEYLLNTYGEKKLEESKKNSERTFQDVVGYTLENRVRNDFSYETGEGEYYELDEIEELMLNKWNYKDKVE